MELTFKGFKGNKLFKNGKVLMTVAATASVVAVASVTAMSSVSHANADTASSVSGLTSITATTNTGWTASSNEKVSENLASQGINNVDDLANYNVVWGDTLTTIANHFNVSVESLRAQFNIYDSNFILAGVAMKDQHNYKNIVEYVKPSTYIVESNTKQSQLYVPKQEVDTNTRIDYSQVEATSPVKDVHYVNAEDAQTAKEQTVAKQAQASSATPQTNTADTKTPVKTDNTKSDDKPVFEHDTAPLSRYGTFNQEDGVWYNKAGDQVNPATNAIIRTAKEVADQKAQQAATKEELRKAGHPSENKTPEKIIDHSGAGFDTLVQGNDGFFYDSHQNRVNPVTHAIMRTAADIAQDAKNKAEADAAKAAAKAEGDRRQAQEDAAYKKAQDEYNRSQAQIKADKLAKQLADEQIYKEQQQKIAEAAAKQAIENMIGKENAEKQEQANKVEQARVKAEADAKAKAEADAETAKNNAAVAEAQAKAKAQADANAQAEKAAQAKADEDAKKAQDEANAQAQANAEAAQKAQEAQANNTAPVNNDAGFALDKLTQRADGFYYDTNGNRTNPDTHAIIRTASDLAQDAKNQADADAAKAEAKAEGERRQAEEDAKMAQETAKNEATAAKAEAQKEADQKTANENWNKQSDAIAQAVMAHQQDDQSNMSLSAADVINGVSIH